MTIATTSLFAYQTAVLPRLGERQREVLAVFEDKPDTSFTQKDVKDALGWEINQITPRVGELEKMGYIEENGQTISAHGRPAKVYRLKQRLF